MVGEPAGRRAPSGRQFVPRSGRAGLRFLAAGSGYTDDTDTRLTGSGPTPSPRPSRTRLRLAGLAVLALALLLPAVPAWAAPSVSFELTSGNTGTGNTIASANAKSKIRVIFDTESDGTDRYAYNLNCGTAFEYAGAPYTALKNILTLKKNTSTGPDIGFTIAHDGIAQESGTWNDKFVITPSADPPGIRMTRRARIWVGRRMAAGAPGSDAPAGLPSAMPAPGEQTAGPGAPVLHATVFQVHGGADDDLVARGPHLLDVAQAGDGVPRPPLPTLASPHGGCGDGHGTDLAVGHRAVMWNST